MPTSCFPCHTQFGFISGMFIIIINFTDFICLFYILKVSNIPTQAVEELFSAELLASWTGGYSGGKGREACLRLHWQTECMSLDSIEDVCLSDKLFFWLQKPFYLSRATFPTPTGAINQISSQSESLFLEVGKWIDWDTRERKCSSKC